MLKETVSEYRQTLDLEASRLRRVHREMKTPDGMPHDTPVRLYGGGVLVFDEFGRLKYHVRSRIDNAQRQNRRLEYLWRNGIRDRGGRYGFTDGSPEGQRFAKCELAPNCRTLQVLILAAILSSKGVRHDREIES